MTEDQKIVVSEIAIGVLFVMVILILISAYI